MKISRRALFAAGGSTAAMLAVGTAPWSSAQSQGRQTECAPHLIVHNAKVTTLQNSQPEAEAFAVRGERIVAVGGSADIMALGAYNTRVIGCPRATGHPGPQ